MRMSFWWSKRDKSGKKMLWLVDNDPMISMIVIGLIAALVGPRLFGAFNEGQLKIVTSPPGATVFINGEQSGRTPVEIPLPKGEYTLKLVSEGYDDVKQTIRITARVTTSLNFNLVPKRYAPPESTRPEP